MRDDWPVSHLGEAVELGKGGSWGADSPAPGLKEAFCLRGTDLAELINGKRPDAPRRWLKQSELSKSQCKPDMVLIETSGSKCGRSLVLTTEMLAQFELPVVYSNFCRTLKIDTSKLSSSYAELWFSHNYWNGVIPSYRATSAMPNLDVKSLLRMETLLIPPLEVQQRIVDLASSVDSYIAALQQQADAARVARSAVLSELLSAGGEDWTDTTLGEAGIINPKSPALAKDAPFVPMDAVQVGRRFVTYFEPRGERSGARASSGDVLFARITPCLENGKVAQIPDGIGMCGGSTEFIVIRGTEQLSADFAYYWATSEQTRTSAARLMTGTTGRQRLSWQDLASLQLNLPPLSEQQRIVGIISSLDDLVLGSESAVTEATNVRSALLSDLLSGNHEIPESYDRLLGAA